MLLILIQADGTWVSNRRGRKRKAPEDNWPSVNKQPRWEEYEGEDDETEDEDFGEAEAGESEEIDDDYTAKRTVVHAVGFVARTSEQHYTEPVMRRLPGLPYPREVQPIQYLDLPGRTFQPPLVCNRYNSKKD